MIKQTLEFYSGFPTILSPNAAAKLKKAKLDGRNSEIFKDRRGNKVEVIGLSRDYHIYILASRISSIFGSKAIWDNKKLTASTTLIFQTYPIPTEIPISIVLDGSSPYKIPSLLRPHDIINVSVESPEHGGLPMCMKFTHKDGSGVSLMLSPDLLHYVQFPDGHQEITDFKVEYIGIACGKNGSRTVFQRAEAHEKIVEIQGDFQQRHGNRSLFIFAYDAGYQMYAIADRGVVITGQGIIPHLVDGGMNSLFEAMEASLISYFKPEYNKEFIDFPKTRPFWLKGTYRSLDGMVLNVDRICVNLMSDCSFNPDGIWSFGRFRSAAQRPKTLHVVDLNITRADQA
ncbi:Lactamase_B domain-containing protein [Pseudomonas chlororaphis]|uniref:hypothetical protein n=1 Tax=Pseudomonas TaxID=286 RepID=UPI0011B64E08|nr:hypothetical protein [Pseudomonas sp. RW409]